MQTVRKNCKHKDCKWRGRFGGEPACVYMMVTGKRRGTEISECDKYEQGTIKSVSTLGGFEYAEDTE